MAKKKIEHNTRHSTAAHLSKGDRYRLLKPMGPFIADDEVTLVSIDDGYKRDVKIQSDDDRSLTIGMMTFAHRAVWV